MNPTEYSIRDLKEWKARRKETWDEQRKQVIFEGNGGIIYPTTLTTQPATQYIKTQTPITVNLTNHGSDARKNEPGTADTEHVMKIIGITIASLLTLIFIVLIVIWICRRSLKNHNKRVSIRRPLQSEDPDHVYAEIEPVSFRVADSRVVQAAFL